jgi:hypothetical protein
LKDWETAQELLAKMVGGKVTPGSGNGRLKGDVTKEGLVFEVKQTQKLSLSIRRKWLSKLKKQAKSDLPIFVLFFQLRCYAYVLELEEHSENIEWESKLLKENELPERLYSGEKVQWILTPWTQLRDL